MVDSITVRKKYTFQFHGSHNLSYVILKLIKAKLHEFIGVKGVDQLLTGLRSARSQCASASPPTRCVQSALAAAAAAADPLPASASRTSPAARSTLNDDRRIDDTSPCTSMYIHYIIYTNLSTRLYITVEKQVFFCVVGNLTTSLVQRLHRLALLSRSWVRFLLAVNKKIKSAFSVYIVIYNTEKVIYCVQQIYHRQVRQFLLISNNVIGW